MIVDCITYNQIDGSYDSDIFTVNEKIKTLIMHLKLQRALKIMCLLMVLQMKVLNVNL